MGMEKIRLQGFQGLAKAFWVNQKPVTNLMGFYIILGNLKRKPIRCKAKDEV